MRGAVPSSGTATAARPSSNTAVMTGGAGGAFGGAKACLDAISCLAAWRLPLEAWTIEGELKTGVGGAELRSSNGGEDFAGEPSGCCARVAVMCSITSRTLPLDA